MTKGQHGNKEARKPKKVHVPNPPALPASLAPTAASMLRPKKRYTASAVTCVQRLDVLGCDSEQKSGRCRPHTQE